MQGICEKCQKGVEATPKAAAAVYCPHNRTAAFSFFLDGVIIWLMYSPVSQEIFKSLIEIFKITLPAIEASILEAKAKPKTDD